MKKIPTLFMRSEEDCSLVTIEKNPRCMWVFEGEGVPTAKLDGTCCLVRDGKLYKRREVKKGKPDPVGFDLSEEDPVTGKRFGWVPVGDGPEDKYHREAFDDLRNQTNGTYELVGPKVQGNPERLGRHLLSMHGVCELIATDRARDLRSFEGIREFLAAADMEGIVWHHPDGRMAKIKRRDFGFEWPIKEQR